MTQPRNFRDRTGHTISPSRNVLQTDMDDFQQFCVKKNHRINVKKSTVMIFNFSKKRDFSPQIKVCNEPLNAVNVTKILGITISDSLKWDHHVEEIRTRAQGRLYLIRKIMQNHFHESLIKDLYFKEIRSVLEYGAVLFHFGLTHELSMLIEETQRIFLKLLSRYVGVKFSYNEACIYFCVEPLFSRRQTLCENFMKRVVKDDKNNLLQERHSDRTLVYRRKYQEHQSYSQRHFTSPLVALTRLANKLKL